MTQQKDLQTSHECFIDRPTKLSLRPSYVYSYVEMDHSVICVNRNCFYGLIHMNERTPQKEY